LTEEKLLTSLDQSVSQKREKCFNRLISKRLAGTPLPYITGIKEFWSIPFRVSPGVLIPRPESELLVEKLLEHSAGEKEIIVDVGTGCGNIAVSLAKELPNTRIYATDVSRRALRLAKKNASDQMISNITFASGRLYAPLDKLRLRGKCDFVVSNPPYVSEEEWGKLSGEIRNYEPKKALVAGETGMEIIRLLIQGAPLYLKPGGVFLIELGDRQKGDVRRIFSSSPAWKEVKFHKDLAGMDRVASAKKSEFQKEAL
jgi:release factor glutamine methyltransferase